MNFFGVDVEGFAVDSDFFKPDQTFCGRPVFDFATLDPKKFVFVIGMNSDWLGNNRSWEFLHDERFISFALLANHVSPKPLIEKDFILLHRDEFAETFSLLDDDFSRLTLFAYLKLMITRDLSDIWPVFKPDIYFNEWTASVKHGTFVDGGAFRGDTIEHFVKWNDGRYEKIFAFEPDTKNFPALETFCHEKNFKNVALFDFGLSDKKQTLFFSDRHDAYSNLSEQGETEIPTEKMDDVLGSEQINFIKLSLNGSELAALKGAEKILENQSPVLAVCVYTKPSEHLISVPQFLKSLRDDYKILLRQHSRFSSDELILYAIPEG